MKMRKPHQAKLNFCTAKETERRRGGSERKRKGGSKGEKKRKRGDGDERKICDGGEEKERRWR